MALILAFAPIIYIILSILITNIFYNTKEKTNMPILYYMLFGIFALIYFVSFIFAFELKNDVQYFENTKELLLIAESVMFCLWVFLFIKTTEFIKK